MEEPCTERSRPLLQPPSLQSRVLAELSTRRQYVGRTVEYRPPEQRQVVIVPEHSRQPPRLSGGALVAPAVAILQAQCSLKILGLLAALVPCFITRCRDGRTERTPGATIQPAQCPRRAARVQLHEFRLLQAVDGACESRGSLPGMDVGAASSSFPTPVLLPLTLELRDGHAQRRLLARDRAEHAGNHDHVTLRGQQPVRVSQPAILASETWLTECGPQQAQDGPCLLDALSGHVNRRFARLLLRDQRRPRGSQLTQQLALQRRHGIPTSGGCRQSRRRAGRAR